MLDLRHFRRCVHTIYNRNVMSNHVNSIAVKDSRNGSQTYGQILRDSTRLGNYLASQIREEDENVQKNIGFMIPNNGHYLRALFGIWRSGSCGIPLDPSHPKTLSQYYLQDSQAKIIVTTKDLQDKSYEIGKVKGAKILVLEDLIQDFSSNDDDLNSFLDSSSLDWNPEDRSLIIYTSGTTGPPKGVVYTHQILANQIQCLISSWDWTYKDCILHVLPLNHVHGLVNCLLCPMSIGARVDILESFNSQRVWEKLLDINNDINVFMAVPTIYSKLIQGSPSDKRDINNILSNKFRLMVSGSAALPQPILKKWESISGHLLLERYGMTEIGMALSNPLEMKERIPGSVGYPLPGVEARIVNDDNDQVEFGSGDELNGHLQIRGLNVFREYWNQPEKTASEFTSDGWFKTGDVASRTKNGDYRILGRSSVDIIKSGGYKISALDIERVILEHPDISEVAVMGIPDDEYGQIIGAVISTNKTKPELELESLLDWTKNKLPNYQHPRKLVNLKSIPRNAMGKVNKKELLHHLFLK